MKRLLAILLVSLSSVCYAQNRSISVKEEVTEDTSDLDAKVYFPKNDMNDNLCALIKVRLTNELKNPLVLEVGGLGVVDREEKESGEIWFYVPSQVKNLSFLCAEYTTPPQIPVVLKEGTVYRITLDPDAVYKTVTNAVLSTGYLKFQVSEPDAIISIGKTRNYELITQNIEGSDYAEMLDFGTYYFKIEKRLYETHEGVITFEESTPKQVIKLAPAYSYLQINSSPSGATAYVNNRKVGTTPCTTERPLPRGEVSLRLELNEYHSLKESVTIEGKGATQTVSYNLKPSFATITLTCPDKEAEIWVDQQMVGKGTWSGHLSSTSKHLVETKHAGHHSQSTNIEVVSGETKTIPLNAPVPLYGSLNIVTKPMGCEIQIDGKTLRETTPYIGQVLVGDHTVTLSKEGHQSTTFPVTIAHNQTATIEKTLQQGPPPEILYTNGSTTEATKPNYSDAFGGAKILSNKYDPVRKCWVLTFDKDVTSIGEQAFRKCASLTSITIPDSVTSIGDEAFSDCVNLAEFNGKFASPDKRCLIVEGRLVSFAPVGLTQYTIPDSVTSIGYSTFSGCTSLTSITIPDSVTSIGEYAFWNCDSLKSVTIPDSVMSIGDSAFKYCDSLTSITIPDGVTSIGEDAFYNCTSLTSVCCKSTTPPKGSPNMFVYNAQGRKIYVPSKSIKAYKKAYGWKEYSKNIVDYKKTPNRGPDPNEILYTNGSTTKATKPTESDAFGGAKIRSNKYDPVRNCWVLTFDKDVIEIGYDAFWQCDSLTSVTIPDSVTSIGEYAFCDCTSLTSITIPDSVTSIGDFAFFDCVNLAEFNGKFASPDKRCLIVEGGLVSFARAGLTEYTIPDGVTLIGWNAFWNCDSLASVTIPDSVTSIGDSAFKDCTSLTSITIPDSVTWIGNEAFSDCVNLAEFNGKFTSPDKRCLIVEGRLVSFAPAGLTRYTIPDSVTEIGELAFNDCTSLTSVTIPDSVTSIRNGAFYSCTSLTSITIPDSVTSIGWNAFNDCTSLTSITIPDSVTSIGVQAFFSCTSLTSVYCKSTTPPQGGDRMFSANDRNRKIYVPQQSVEAYKNAKYWGNYTDSIVGYDF